MRRPYINRFIPFCFMIILISISSNLIAQYIKLTWNPNPENDIKYYGIYRASTNIQETKIANVPATDAIFRDYNIVIDHTYYYRITSVDTADNISDFSDPIEVRTDYDTMVIPIINGIPENFYLSQNYPNPFNPETKFEYYVAKNSTITLAVHNLLGEKIKTFVSGYKTPGIYGITWDGRDDFSKKLATGIYFARYKAGNFRQTGSMILQE